MKLRITTDHIQAYSTLAIALVTVWTLFLTPVGERLRSQVNQTMNAKITLRAVWSKFDDGLAENEYFADVAADYHAHVKWANSPGGLTPAPSMRWINTPHRDGITTTGIVPIHEPGRWGDRQRTIYNWWPYPPGRLEDPLTAHKELSAYLDGLLEEHFGGGGYGALATGYGVIEEMKRDEAVEFLGVEAAEMVRGKLDEFLRQHPLLTSKAVRIRLTKPYSDDEVVEAGEEIGSNIREFRDALRNFVRIESSPYF